MEYLNVKERYPIFYYHDFEIYESEEEVQIAFDFEIEGLSHFNPVFVVPKAHNREVGFLRVFREAAFSLGLIELISYWKLTCAPRLIIECGHLNEDQITWWKKLYFNGLQEFFYHNTIETTLDSFMEITCTGETINGQEDRARYHGNLIPVGGGKDSFVSMELLKDYNEENHAFVINAVKSAVHSAEAAGYHDDRLIRVERTLDLRMLDFNKQGFLNGHTPFSALAAFAAVVTAIVYEKQNICLSNEASANESTIKGTSINHQYSKTFEFEQDFKYYMDHYLTREIHYFSLLRPLSELQITSIFSTLKDYLHVFRSCNVGQKEEIWCGHCAKCLFVCVMLSAFLSDEELLSIFGKNMLNDEEMRQLFQQLTGILDDKPFECVGTREEVNTAIAMSIRAHEAQNKPLSKLYEEYKQTSYYTYYQNATIDYEDLNETNLVPEEYMELVRNAMKERAHG